MRSYALQIEDLPSTEQGVRRIRLRAHVAGLGTSDSKLPHISGRIFWITLSALGNYLICASLCPTSNSTGWRARSTTGHRRVCMSSSVRSCKRRR